MPTYAETRAGYLNLWNQAQVLPGEAAAAKVWAQKIGDATHRPHFANVQNLTGVPWFMIGLMLMRESSLNLGTYLGNGQSLSQTTTEVPAGRGPFSTFEAGAVDALKLQGMTGITDWPVEHILYWLERFNGQGYFKLGVNDPYLWSWTTLYHGGKFISDGQYSSTEVDPQPGCAAILKVLIQTNPDVASFFAPTKETTPVTPTATTPMPPPPPAPHPAPHATPTIAPIQLPPISLTQIEHTMATLVTIGPMVSMVFPPAAPFLAYLPLIDGLLKEAVAIQAGTNTASVGSIISTALHNVANIIEGKAPTT